MSAKITLQTKQGVITKEIQKAIDDCFLSGGGTVVLEAGKYEVGGLRLRSNVTLYLKSGARLQGVRDPEAYRILDSDTIEPLREDEKTDVVWTSHSTLRNNDFIHKSGSRWNNAIIRILNAHDCAVIGETGSVIDGADCYDERGEERYRGPHGFSIRNSKNVTCSGYTVQNTGNWAHLAFFCEDLTFADLTIVAGHDGVHVAACDRVKILNCDMQTGDDCVAGFDNQDVLVDNCLLNTACSAFRFGGTNVLVQNCKIYGPARYVFRGSLSLEDRISGAPTPSGGRRNMLSLFTYYSDFTLQVRKKPENIVIQNCQVQNADRFLHFNFSGNEYWQCNRPLGGIRFRNVTASGIAMSLCAYGSKDEPFDLAIEDCKLEFGKEQSELIRAAYWKSISLKGVTAIGVNGPLVTSWGGKGEVCVRNVQGVEDGVQAATVPFTCDPI